MFDFFKKEDINQGVDEFNSTKDAFLLDVRTNDEFRSGHIPGSKNLSINEIRNISSVINDEETPLFVYCLSGARSSNAVSLLKTMGYTNVKNIGGINSYKGPIERGV